MGECVFNVAFHQASSNVKPYKAEGIRDSVDGLLIRLSIVSRIPFYMSTDCENLLKKFLVLNPAKRASLEAIMRDKWMNTGYEEEELRPFIEPQQDFKDHKRIGDNT